MLTPYDNEIEKLKDLGNDSNNYLEIDEWKNDNVKQCAKYWVCQAKREECIRILEIIEKELKYAKQKLDNFLPEMTQANLSGVIIILECVKSQIHNQQKTNRQSVQDMDVGVTEALLSTQLSTENNADTQEKVSEDECLTRSEKSPVQTPFIDGLDKLGVFNPITPFEEFIEKLKREWRAKCKRMEFISGEVAIFELESLIKQLNPNLTEK